MPSSPRHRYRGLALFAVLAAVTFAACSSDGSEAADTANGPVQIEIISLDHAPIRPTTAEAEGVAAEFDVDVTL